MLHKSIRRGGLTLALLASLALTGATPASAQGFGPRAAFDWLADLFGIIFAVEDTGGGSPGGLSAIWANEGPGFDPNGQPLPHGAGGTTDEGPGFDPNGVD